MVSPGVMTGLIVCLLALAVAGGCGALWRARNGRMRGVPVVPGSRMAGERVPAGRQPGHRPAAQQEPEFPGGARLTATEIGQPLGTRATLVQFSTSFCAPCRVTRRVLAEVAGMTDGVAHVEIDAESRLDLVRRLDVRRTPTVLVLGPDGQITRRASGQPRKADVIAAIGYAGAV